MLAGELVEAYEMSQQEHDQIRRRLEKLVGQPVQLETRVDASILGGFIVTLQDMVLDYSMKAQLSQIRQQLET